MSLNLTTLAQTGCVAKKNHEFRLITELRHLNKFCSVPRFRKDHIRDAVRLVIPGDKFVIIDIKDGVFHIEIAPENYYPKT